MRWGHLPRAIHAKERKPQAAPPRAVEPREDPCPVAPAEAPQRPPEPARRRSPSPRRGPGGHRRGRDYDSPGGGDCAAYRRPYRTPERYIQQRSERRASDGPAPATRGNDRAPARRDDRPRHDTPNTALERGPHGRRNYADRRRLRSLSPDIARRSRYDAPDTGRRPEWEPRTTPHTRPAHMPQEEPPYKRQRGRKKGRQPAAQPCTGTPHRPPTQAPAAPKQRRASWPPAHQQHSRPGMGTRTRPGKGVPGQRRPPRVSEAQRDAPPERASQAPQQPWNRDAPTVLHIQRLPVGWSHRHWADRFMWMDGAVGVVQAFFGGENQPHLPLQRSRGGCMRCG